MIKKLILLCFFNVFALFSQEKIEREYHIKATEAPKKAQETIKKWNFKQKVKWYVEESQDGKTFEAKVYHQSKKHSIEFTKLGNIIDVEIVEKFYKLPKKEQLLIKKTLSKRFKKFKIKKIQIQYKEEENTLYNLLFNLKKSNKKIDFNYEIVVKAKEKKSYHLYELLLHKNGKVLKQLKFAPSNLDNLEF